MLQQTQVVRVIPKFKAFIAAFPDEKTLSDASLADILRLWQGLGYNRRAKYLHDAVKKIVYEWGGLWPQTAVELQQLPGVGPNTAGALVAYAFNQKSIFIETNIRTVYFLHYFSDQNSVKDTQIQAVLARTLDTEHPREFYWALMDYGSWLKSNGLRNLEQSEHYVKQSPLDGSVRQVRGAIVAALTKSAMKEQDLIKHLNADHRFDTALQGLLRDGLIEHGAKGLRLRE
jgi:A/G-specific adenine glycosylase